MMVFLALHYEVWFFVGYSIGEGPDWSNGGGGGGGNFSRANLASCNTSLHAAMLFRFPNLRCGELENPTWF